MDMPALNTTMPPLDEARSTLPRPSSRSTSLRRTHKDTIRALRRRTGQQVPSSSAASVPGRGVEQLKFSSSGIHMEVHPGSLEAIRSELVCGDFTIDLRIFPTEAPRQAYSADVVDLTGSEDSAIDAPAPAVNAAHSAHCSSCQNPVDKGHLLKTCSCVSQITR